MTQEQLLSLMGSAVGEGWEAGSGAGAEQALLDHL